MSYQSFMISLTLPNDWLDDRFACGAGRLVGRLQSQLREVLVCIWANSANKELLISAKSLNLLKDQTMQY